MNLGGSRSKSIRYLDVRAHVPQVVDDNTKCRVVQFPERVLRGETEAKTFERSSTKILKDATHKGCICRCGPLQTPVIYSLGVIGE